MTAVPYLHASVSVRRVYKSRNKQVDSKKITEHRDSIPFPFRQAECINLLSFFKVVFLDAEIIDKSIYRLGKIISIAVYPTKSNSQPFSTQHDEA
jgi:hypothetical protein